MRTLSRRKAEGMDGISAEFLISLRGEVKEKFVELCQLIYRDEAWPKDFLQSVMIPIEKKNVVRCEGFRTISQISLASKVVLRILAKRIKSKSEEFLGKDQFGFRSGRGTRDAVGVMRCLSERSIEFNQDLYVCFIDYEKAFDRVNWRKLMEILQNIGVDWRDRRLIATLYMSQTAAVRLNYELTEPSEVGRGVRQGCLISPTLFNIYAEAMIKYALDDLKEGICVGGELVQSVRYANDQTMTANTAKGLQKILGEANKVVKKYGMKIKIKKTKVIENWKKTQYYKVNCGWRNTATGGRI